MEIDIIIFFVSSKNSSRSGLWNNKLNLSCLITHLGIAIQSSPTCTIIRWRIFTFVCISLIQVVLIRPSASGRSSQVDVWRSSR